MQAANGPDETLPDFEGKCVMFYMNHVAAEGETLDSPKFERQAGRLFVVGNVVAPQPNYWAAGLRTGLAWDQVVSYLVFETPEDYAARFRSHARSARTPKSFRLFRRG